jgi:hypothetical protein
MRLKMNRPSFQVGADLGSSASSHWPPLAYVVREVGLPEVE